MGKKDLTEKILLDWNDVFADVFNSLIFNGKEIMKPEELENVSPVSVYKVDESRKGELREQIRDVVKIWRNSAFRIAFCGIENQTSVDKFMPLRVIGYDGATYRSQLPGKKTTKPCPVVTLVLYFGKGLWTGPRSLSECLDIPDFLAPYVSDYRINVIEIGQLSPEQIACMKSDFRIIADFFAQSEQMGEYKQKSTLKFKHREEMLHFFSVFTNDDRFESIEKGANSMCEILDKVENKGRLEGRLEGRVEGREERIAKERTHVKAMMKNLHISLDEAMLILEIPASEKDLFI